MMAFSITAFTYIGRAIESNGMTFVVDTSVRLSATLLPLSVTFATLWVMYLAFATMRGAVQEPLHKLVWDGVKMNFIFVLAFGTGMYQTEVVGTVIGVTNMLVGAVSNAAGTQCTIAVDDPLGIYKVLDCEATRASHFAVGFFKNAFDIGAQFSLLEAGDVLSKFVSFTIGGLLVGLGEVIFFGLLAVEYITARLALTIVLCLGPLFIACLAFEPSRKYFDGWLSKVVFCIVLQMVGVLFLAMTLPILNSYMANTLGVDTAFDAVSVALSIGNALGQIEGVLMGLLFLLVLFAFMTTKIDGIASAITGHHSHSSGFGAMMGFAMGRQMGIAMRGLGKMNMPGPRPRGPGGVISQR